ncbi:MAG: hypothetical protein ACRDVO_16605 [Jiangellaceae bacterium]
MSADFDSDLRRRLEGLGSDAGRANLPGPAAARQRARRRARNQAVGAVLGAAVVVGGAVIAVAQPTLLTAPDPATSPGETVTSSPGPTPSPSPSSPDVPTLPTSVLLQLSDIEPEGEPIGWAEWPGEAWPCTPVAATSDRILQRMFVNPEAGRIEHIVEATASGQAPSRFAEIRDDLISCVESGAASGAEFRLDEIWVVTGVGDEAVLLRYWAPLREGPPGESQLIVSVSIARSGDAVTTVTRGGFAQDANVPDTSEDAQAAVTRLCAATGGACVTDPDQQRTYPEPAADLPGWLTVADVVEATGEDRISAAGEVLTDATGFPFVCFQTDPGATGATSVESRTFYDALDPTAISVDEYVARFPSGSAARAYYDTLTAEGDSCSAEPSLVVQNTGAVAGDGGLAGTTWRSTVAETDSVFVYGVVVNGSAVGYVSTNLDSAADDELATLLRLAGERLGEAG